MKFEWKCISETEGQMTHRSKVIGGWIVSCASYLYGEIKTDTMIFITDPNHEWTIEE